MFESGKLAIIKHPTGKRKINSVPIRIHLYSQCCCMSLGLLNFYSERLMNEEALEEMAAIMPGRQRINILKYADN